MPSANLFLSKVNQQLCNNKTGQQGQTHSQGVVLRCCLYDASKYHASLAVVLGCW